MPLPAPKEFSQADKDIICKKLQNLVTRTGGLAKPREGDAVSIELLKTGGGDNVALAYKVIEKMETAGLVENRGASELVSVYTAPSAGNPIKIGSNIEIGIEEGQNHRITIGFTSSKTAREVMTGLTKACNEARSDFYSGHGAGR